MEMAQDNKFGNAAILNELFSSRGDRWSAFLANNETMNIAFYPSAYNDFRLALYAQPEVYAHLTGESLNTACDAPNLLIMSDYRDHGLWRYNPGAMVFSDNRTDINILEYERLSLSEFVDVRFNPRYIILEAPHKRAEAYYLKIEVRSKTLGFTKHIDVLYVIMENTNLLDQLVLRTGLRIRDILWKRDGTGFGGGMVSMNMLMDLAPRLGIQNFYMWNIYLKNHFRICHEERSPENLTHTCGRIRVPPEIRPYISPIFSYGIHKRWSAFLGGDVVHYYQLNQGD